MHSFRRVELFCGLASYTQHPKRRFLRRVLPVFCSFSFAFLFFLMVSAIAVFCVSSVRLGSQSQNSSGPSGHISVLQRYQEPGTRFPPPDFLNIVRTKEVTFRTREVTHFYNPKTRRDAYAREPEALCEPYPMCASRKHSAVTSKRTKSDGWRKEIGVARRGARLCDDPLRFPLSRVVAV
jgi:hypothetical protein